MFGTMIILLPSRYTGGEVHLTHASKTEVIDFSASSAANTAVLAWYTDVLHEVKPVTSGYRLALSYNLIHPSSRLPLPMAPTYDGPCAELRQVLRKWEGKYKKPKEHQELEEHEELEEPEESEEPEGSEDEGSDEGSEDEKSEECKEPDHIAYLLKHQYSDIDFSRGASCLKGEDDERVALVRVAAEGLGLAIFLAKIEYHFSGNADEFGGHYGRAKRRRECEDSGSDSDSESVYNQFDNGRVEISLSAMVDLSGNVVLGPNHLMKIGEDCFLPTDAFNDEGPDDEKEEITGNVSLLHYHTSLSHLAVAQEGTTFDYCTAPALVNIINTDTLKSIQGTIALSSY